jgi:excisionase family DNA binding protein
LQLGSGIRFDPVALKAWVRSRSGISDSPDETSAAQLAAELRVVRTQLSAMAGASDFAIPAEEAARRLGCGRTTVFDLLKRRRLIRTKSPGRRVLITAASVEQLLADNQPQPRRPEPAKPARIENAVLRLKL